MRNLVILVILSVMILSSLAHATLAICPACKGDPPDWSASATDFLEGKPTNDIPSGLNGAQQARLLDAQIDSKKSAGQAPNAVSNPAVTPTHNSTPTLNIVLDDISAAPNPANFSDPVMITAVFGNNSSRLMQLRITSRQVRLDQYGSLCRHQELSGNRDWQSESATNIWE